LKLFLNLQLTGVKKTTIFLLLIFFLSSCSSYLIKNKNIIKKKDTIKLHCKGRSNREIISNYNPAITEYKKILKNSKTNLNNLSIIEEAVLFSLMQMNFRPDITTPTSRLLLIIKQNDQINYYDFDSPNIHINDTPSFLAGLNYILKKYNSKQTLFSLATLIDSTSKFAPTVSFKLGAFVESKKEILSKNATLSKIFFRGDQPLKQGDSIEKINFKQIITLAQKDFINAFLNQSHLFSYSLDNGLQVKCNHDFNLYKHSIFPITNEDAPANTYGIKNKRNDMFIAISFQNIDSISSYKSSFLIKGKYPIASKALCIVEKEQSIILSSTKTRDPGQILYNFIELGDKFPETKQELEIMSNFPRHYFLMNPKRMLFETDRATKEQIDNILALRFPIYHQRDIGNISAYTFSKELNVNSKDGFILDPRENASIYCEEEK
jgi:hypothetical protein